MRRLGSKMRGERYCGDVLKAEVHDLLEEKPGCGIDSIIEAEQEAPFLSLAEAHEKGFRDCPLCITEVEIESEALMRKKEGK